MQSIPTYPCCLLTVQQRVRASQHCSAHCCGGTKSSFTLVVHSPLHLISSPSRLFKNRPLFGAAETFCRVQRCEIGQGFKLVPSFIHRNLLFASKATRPSERETFFIFFYFKCALFYHHMIHLTEEKQRWTED